MNSVLIELIFIALVGYAFFTDIIYFRIPNVVPVGLAVLFAVYIYWLPLKTSVMPHLIIGLMAFFITLLFYLRGWMGGGDVKLIAVLTLWTGPQNAFQFLTIMSLIGGLIAACLLIIGRRLALDPGFARYIPSRRLRAWAQRRVFPYGVAINAAALISAPAIFN